MFFLPLAAHLRAESYEHPYLYMNESASVPHCESLEIDVEIYEELKRLAARRMAQQARAITFQPTMLVHEAWLRMGANDHTRWKDRNHFLATAAVTMRHILIDNARKRERLRHGKGQVRTETGRLSSLAAQKPDEQILRINEGITALETVHPLRAKIVVARFFGGLSNTEIADSFSISLRGVERHWAAAKLWLYRWMETSGEA